MHPFTKRMVQNAEALEKARAKDPTLNKSIHPRVVGGRTRHTKVNTAGINWNDPNVQRVGRRNSERSER